MTDETLIKFLRLPRVKELTALGRTQIYTLEKQGRFPRHHRILANTTVWIEGEIQAWMAERVQECHTLSSVNRMEVV